MGKEAFLLSELLEDFKHLCGENCVEEPVITNTGTFKRKTIDTFTEEISFYPNRKYLIVHSSDINPGTTILGVLKNKELKDDDIIKLFGNMIPYLALQPKTKCLIS